MASRAGVLDYLKAAFNARPMGMFVPPNWIGLGIFGLLGLQDPGFWVLGTGLELAYLSVLATNARFQRFVQGRSATTTRQAWEARLEQLLARLGSHERARYAALAGRCRSILELQHHTQAAPDDPGLDAHSEGLGRLTWMYLRLLLMRQAIGRVLRETDAGERGERLDLEEQIRSLRARLDAGTVTDELRRSLSGQVEILEQRLARRAEARDKLAYIDAELTRIEHQAELIREQAVLSTDPRMLSTRIDDISATLGGTAQWIRDQQQVYGAMEDLLNEPPPLAVQARVGQSQ